MDFVQEETWTMYTGIENKGYTGYKGHVYYYRINDRICILIACDK